jgi:hypothetical protein
VRKTCGRINWIGGTTNVRHQFVHKYLSAPGGKGGEEERKRLERDFFKGVPSARIAPTRVLLHALQAPFLQSKSMNYLNSPRVGVRLNAS